MSMMSVRRNRILNWLVVMRKSILLFCGFVCASNSLCAQWPQFRGPNSSGIAEGPAPPIEFGPGKNELWKIPFPPGHSSPCVSRDAIFLTAFKKDASQLEVVSVARNDGSIRWRRRIPIEKVEKGHPSFSPASSTVATDGERVVAYFGSFGLICYDVKGAKLWEFQLPMTKSYGGNATSPAIIEDRVILYRGCYDDHFLLAVDKQTGKEIWRSALSERFSPDMACTSTPILVDDKLILHSARAIQAYRVSNGELVWHAHCSTTATSTPVLAGQQVVVATWNQTGEPALTPTFPSFDDLLAENDKNQDGLIAKKEFPRLMIFHRSEGTEAPQNGAPLSFRHVDKNRNETIEEEEWATAVQHLDERRKSYVPHGILAIDVQNDGTLEPEQIRRLESKGIPEVPSPLYYDGRIYFVKNGGILTCLDIETGKRVHRLRTRGTGTHYASPIIAGSKLYSTSGDGTVSVLSLKGKPKVIATNELGDDIYATPAAVGGVLYFRTHTSLRAYGNPN